MDSISKTEVCQVDENGYLIGYREKTCTDCCRTLPLESFPIRVDQGVERRRRQCCDCKNRRRRDTEHASEENLAKARLHSKSRMDIRRAELINFKLERGCMDCGYNKHGAALDFDHRPGTEKLFMIMRDGLTRSPQALWDEVAKCDVVCANCHRIRTAERMAAQRIKSA